MATLTASYPTHLLEGCKTGLCLFAAAFLGENDAAHFASAGLTTTCVDVDEAKLAEMAPSYPEDWCFMVADAWEFAEAHGEKWDVVSADTFTGADEQRSLRSLELWCSLARKAVTVTLCPGSMYRVPKGWRAWHMKRSPIAMWLVLERL